MAYYGSHENRKMPFTREEIGRAFDTEIVPFLQSMGYELSKKDSKTMTLKGYGGLVFFNQSNMFHWHSENRSGNLVDFLQEWEQVDFIGAIEMILNQRAYSHQDFSYTAPPPAPKKNLILPPMDDNSWRVQAYLCKTRGLEPSIVEQLISQKLIYQSKVERSGKTYRNCAFVGVDKNDIPKHCALRSLSPNLKFHQDVTDSDKSYAFSMVGQSSRAYIYEAPIDAMSHASLFLLHGMDWQADHRITVGGLSDKSITRYLKDYSQVKELVFCYDNDYENKTPEGKLWNQGQEQAIKSAELFEQSGYACQIQTPRTKDFNSDLLLYREMLRSQGQQQNQQEVYER